MLAPLIKCRGYKVWPRIPPHRFNRWYWRKKQEEDDPKILNTTFFCTASNYTGKVQWSWCFVFTASNSSWQVSCLQGRKNLTGIDYCCIFCKTSSVALRFLVFILWMISRVLQRMGSSWDVAKESHRFPGAWSFEKERKNLVKLLSVEFQTWNWRRSPASRR